MSHLLVRDILICRHNAVCQGGFALTDLHVVVLQHGQDFLRRASENLSRQVPKLGPHQVQQGLIRCPSLLRGWPIRPSSIQIKHRGLQATQPCQHKSRKTLTVTCRTCFHIEDELCGHCKITFRRLGASMSGSCPARIASRLQVTTATALQPGVI